MSETEALAAGWYRRRPRPRRIKAMFAAAPGNTLHQQLDLEAHLQGDAGRSADFAEGVRAFQEQPASGRTADGCAELVGALTRGHC